MQPNPTVEYTWEIDIGKARPAIQHFKRQPHKMVKHTQTLFECV